MQLNLIKQMRNRQICFKKVAVTWSQADDKVPHASEGRVSLKSSHKLSISDDKSRVDLNRLADTGKRCTSQINRTVTDDDVAKI